MVSLQCLRWQNLQGRIDDYAKPTCLGHLEQNNPILCHITQGGLGRHFCGAKLLMVLLTNYTHPLSSDYIGPSCLGHLRQNNTILSLIAKNSQDKKASNIAGIVAAIFCKKIGNVH